MATYTQLSLTATPGRRYSFSPKTEAGGKGSGPFTALSVLAVPGAIRSFTAKTPAGGGPPHEGLFTELSVIALPGGRHVFLPKELAVTAAKRETGGRQFLTNQAQLYKRITQEDKELLDIVIQSFISGIFD